MGITISSILGNTQPIRFTSAGGNTLSLVHTFLWAAVTTARILLNRQLGHAYANAWKLDTLAYNSFGSIITPLCQSCNSWVTEVTEI